MIKILGSRDATARELLEACYIKQKEVGVSAIHLWFCLTLINLFSSVWVIDPDATCVIPLSSCHPEPLLRQLRVAGNREAFAARMLCTQSRKVHSYAETRAPQPRTNELESTSWSMVISTNSTQSAGGVFRLSGRDWSDFSDLGFKRPTF